MTANAQGAEIRVSSDSTMNATETTTWQRWARRVYRLLAAAFLAGLTAQVFIVGMALFVNGTRWSLHQSLGHALFLPPVAMLLLALAGRMHTRIRLLTLVPIVLMAAQIATGMIGGWAGALHPVNALLLIWIGAFLFRQTAKGTDSSQLATQQKDLGK